MAGVLDQLVTDEYALYLGDCMEVLPTLPDGCVNLSVYSPPFQGLYQYTSSDRDLSNCRSSDEFFEHYAFVVRELLRLTVPGRMTVVHCADVPTGNTGRDGLFDLPGEVVRLHERVGFEYVARRCIWKEPLAVRNRTMVKGLAHRTIVDDSAYSTVAGADYLLTFRKRGENAVPIAHPQGLTEYAGARQVPAELQRFRGWKGSQIENRFSHWVWRQYASSVWDDIRGNQGDRSKDEGAVLPYRQARDEEDEKHVHPLQRDVIARALVLYSNAGETVLTPFLGVGSEVYEAVRAGRRGIGVEIKPSYYRQAVKNLAALEGDHEIERLPLLEALDG